MESKSIFTRFAEIVSPDAIGNRSAYVMEFGACDGYHTNLLCEILSSRGGPYSMHAFEPGHFLLNSFVSQNARHFPSLVFNVMAVGAVDGITDFYQSQSTTPGQSFIGSSSIKEPDLVTEIYPMNFQKTSCQCCRLDTYCHEKSIPYIDFIWSDIQGAEKDLILGGQDAFSRTRFFYTEVSSAGLYADTGYSTPDGLMRFLPGKWELVEDYGGDVLFKNLDYPHPQ